MNTALLSLVVCAATGARALSQRASLVSVDQCATINADLSVPVSGGNIDFGHIDDCLCLSQINSFMQSNPTAEAASSLAGQDATTEALVTLITTSSFHSSCTYPDHGVALCTSGNPCGFTCQDGFVPSPASNPTTCACESPNTVCNGVCGRFKACSSKRSARNDLEGLFIREPGLFEKRSGTNEPKKKRGLGNGEKRRNRALGKRLGERLGCKAGWEACGVYGGSRTAWECVDTARDLESCGGCTIPVTLPSSPLTVDDLLTFGVDCTALPGVADVSCVRGECAVRRCERGWTVSRDGTRCQRALPSNADFDELAARELELGGFIDFMNDMDR